ncbi:MAG TPA: ATP-dependent metallopeptidase FtsH/Yme1/Tma family protein, partial [Ktedonobacteraceae bacterium]|nr:ATP-dependent metallopeptidase FtsH/Yme1/Tma family protein [Ktedonobacteraceae bacterium]
MDKQTPPDKTTLWLQNNNEPRRQQNSMRPGPGNNGRPNQNGQPPRGRSSYLNRWLLIIVLVMLGIYAYSFFNANNSNTPQRDQLTYTQFLSQVNNGNVSTATFEGSSDIVGNFRQSVGSFSEYQVYQLPNGDPNLAQLLIEKDVVVVPQPPQDNSFWLNILIAFLPWVIVIALFIFLTRRAGQGQQGIFSFGKSRAKVILEDRPSTTFADVAGVDESKYELQEVVEFLKTPQKFQRLGGKIPRGVLLVGPPGTGKTLLARAVA